MGQDWQRRWRIACFVIVALLLIAAWICVAAQTDG
jgi:hypothetical protein